jgi:hypothetical protein
MNHTTRQQQKQKLIQKRKNMAKYTPIIFLIGMLILITYDKYMFATIVALLFSTTVIYWNSNLDIDDPSRCYDITFTFITLIVSVYYALTTYSNNCIIAWLSLLIVGLLIFGLNTHLYWCQTAKGYSARPEQTGAYDYFSDGYVSPDSIYHEDAFTIPNMIHICIMHWLLPTIFITLLLTQYPPKGIKDCFSFNRS